MEAPPVQFVTSADGCRIAYTVMGEGQPLVVWSGGFDSAHYTARHHPEWLAALASRFRAIYADMRGRGLSQRGLKEDMSMADYDRDVEAVGERFPGQPLMFPPPLRQAAEAFDLATGALTTAAKLAA